MKGKNPKPGMDQRQVFPLFGVNDLPESAAGNDADFQKPGPQRLGRHRVSPSWCPFLPIQYFPGSYPGLESLLSHDSSC